MPPSILLAIVAVLYVPIENALGKLAVDVCLANHSIVKSPVPTAQSELPGVSINELTLAAN